MTIKPGRVPKRKNIRDFDLIRDYQAVVGGDWKFSVSELVGKYKISSARIYDILTKNNIPKRGILPINN